MHHKSPSKDCAMMQKKLIILNILIAFNNLIPDDTFQKMGW